MLLNYAEGVHRTDATVYKIAPFAAEAAWVTGRWEVIEKYIPQDGDHVGDDFNVTVARILLCLRDNQPGATMPYFQSLRDKISASMTFSATSSLTACHEAMLRCHVLADLEMIIGLNGYEGMEPAKLMVDLARRSEVLGAYVSDKQYVLGIHRAAMHLMRYVSLRENDFDAPVQGLTSRLGQNSRTWISRPCGWRVHGSHGRPIR